MTKLAGTILKLVNIFVVLVYLSACLIPFLPAGKYWMIAVLGLVFPILFIIVAGFLAGWIIAGSKWFLLSLVALALSWQQLSVVAGITSKKEFTLLKTNETLRILTWNTSSWGESSKNYNNSFDYRPFMFDLIKKQQADVLCFQEYWDIGIRYSNNSNIQAFKEMGYPYSYFVKSITQNINDKMGVIILSRFPITDSSNFTYGKDDNAEHLIYADIQFHQKKIRVFTTHLQSVQFGEQEYSTLGQIKEPDKRELKDSKTIVHKLKNAYWFRGTQADFVQQKIKESPYPAIICGDFNDVPNSYTYFTIKGNLQDAFLKKGTGLGRTFQYLFPTLRIDYILADKKFEVDQFNRIIYPYSDHYPVVADLHFATGF